MTTPRRYARYVALGDSSTEGLDDPDGAGGYRGWANRLAEHIAARQGTVAYANLAVRGRCARQIKDEQLGPALVLAPDLATVVAGMNDLLRGGFDARAIGDDIEAMQRALVQQGALVISFTLPDISHRLAVAPLARRLSRRAALLNDEIRRASAASGACLLDLAAIPLAADPRLWSRDRLHANTAGHTRIGAGLAQLIGLADTDDAWRAPLPPLPPPSLRAQLLEHATWGRDYFAPWLWRRARGRTAGDHLTAKRPRLVPMTCADRP